MAAQAGPKRLQFDTPQAPKKTSKSPKSAPQSPPQDDLADKVATLKSTLERALNDKKAQKQQIQQWMDTFQQRHRREATKEDKEVVRPMFTSYKELEKRCKDLAAELEPLEKRLAQSMATFSAKELVSRIRNAESQLEKKTAERKAQKHDIQTWLDGFKERHGREATKEDKETVRPLFNRYKELERQAKELGDELQELRRLHKEAEIAEASATTLTTTQASGDALGITRAPSALDLSGQGAVLAKTAALGEEGPGKAEAARINLLQERFARLAAQQEQMAGIEMDIMADTAAVLPRSNSMHKRAPSTVMDLGGTSVSGVGGEATLQSSMTLGGSTAGTADTTRDPTMPAIPIPFDTRMELEDDGTRFGPGSLFERDARRDDRFLEEEAQVPLPRLVDLHDVVLDIRRSLATETMPDFLSEFEERVPGEEVVVAKIPVEEIERREKVVEQVRLQHAQAEAQRYRKRELDLAWREHISRSRIMDMEKDARTRLDEDKKRVVEENIANERALQRHFVAAKERLEKLIYSQQAHFTEKYGTVVPGQLAVARRFHINWDYEPQPVEMRVHLMRAAKNKLPAGRYCILLTPYERLGGHPITWSKLSFQGMGYHRPQATRPVKHKGRFFDTTIRFDQSVFALCPSRKQVRPSNCLVVEVFNLAGKDNPKDQIVGWGVLPMCNPRFRIVQGRFKIPLMKGEPTPLIDKYSQLESLLTEDLTHWLCNVYVDVRHLSKEHLDKHGKLFREYDLEYDYVNRKLLLGPRPKALQKLDRQDAKNNGNRKRAREGGEEKDKDKEAEGGIEIVDTRRRSQADLLVATDPSHPEGKPSGWAPQSHETWFSKREELFRHPPRMIARKDSRRRKAKFGTASSMQQGTAQDLLALATPRSNKGGDTPMGMGMGMGKGKGRPGDELPSTPRSPGADTVTSLNSSVPAPVEEEEEDESSSSSEGEEARSSGDEWVLDGGETRPLLPNKEIGLPPTRESRNRMRRRRQEGSRWDADGLGIVSTTTAPPGSEDATNGKGKARRRSLVGQSVDKLGATKRLFEDGVEHLEWFKLSDPQEMEYYSQAVAEDPTKMEKPLPQEITRSKILYLKTELLADLGLQNWRSTEFWVTLTIFTIMFWLRMYIHYIGQYLYLWARGVPVYTFKATLYCMYIKYISSTSAAVQEIAVVLIGPLSNILVFIALTLAGWGMVKSVGQIPDSTSKAIAAFGIATLFDPLLVFIVDVAASHYSCSKVAGCEVNYTAPTCRCFTGDAFKLFERFNTDENNGVAGAFITLIVYLAEFLVAGFCLYNYLIYVHMNGRMLDVYKRLHGTSEDFFTPHDFEVTYAELAYICDKARKWTHPKGTRRRIAVCDYDLTDPLEPDFVKEVTTHLTIYNQELDGSKTLYRHFLRMPDGTIIELFDVVAKSLGSQFDSLEKLLLSDQNVAGASARGIFANFLT